MLASVIRILLGLTQCLVVASCMEFPGETVCAEKQDVAAIYTSDRGFDTRDFNNFVVKRCEKEGPCGTENFIGSKTASVEFPLHITVQFFSLNTLLKELDFEIPANSILQFYNGDECKIIHDSTITVSGEIYRWEREGMFYQDIKRLKNREAFIDSSRSDVLCWIIEQIDNNNSLRCIYQEKNTYGQ